MKAIITLVLLFINFLAVSQKHDSDKILAEGVLLYRMEAASWIGTDDFLARFPHKRDSIGGYLSYETDNHLIHTIFFNKHDNDRILVRYLFDSMPSEKNLLFDTLTIQATSHEKDLITIRQDALKKIIDNSDHFFTHYESTSFNLIPIMNGKGKTVYVLTGPRVSGIVLLGNDYKLSYNNNNVFVKKEKIHNSLVHLPYKSDKDEKIVATMHSHAISAIIDATDICTLLLYRDHVEWKKHYVIGKKYVSIFDMENVKLLILSRKAWDRINGKK
jgi:hypothetical protein